MTKPMSAKEWMNEIAPGVIDHSGGWYWAMDAFAAYRVREFAERVIEEILKRIEIAPTEVIKKSDTARVQMETVCACIEAIRALAGKE